MTATAALIVLIVGVVVVVWTSSEREQIRAEKRAEARAFSAALAAAFMNELDDENWSQIRIGCEMLLAQNEDFVYVLVSDRRQKERIVAAAPVELAEHWVPDVVPLHVTRAAVRGAPEPLAQETWLLRDVAQAGRVRARRGERIVEVATDIRIASGVSVGTFRVGISLGAVDQAVTEAVTKVVGVGLASLLVGLLGAFLVARRMTRPVEELTESVALIAAGDLDHRAGVRSNDEIGALARAFNEMQAALAGSFAQLRKTLASFERFVPRKFLQVVAPEGIENIQVGVASTRRITVLFSDIRGFTTLAEGMTPLEVFHFLNDYLARMGDAIARHGGFVDKYIGDAIMALFDDEHTDGVLDAALAMRRTLVAFNAERAAAGKPTIDTGIGIHGGEVIMGTIGFTSKIESTVVGDAVNLASRVEGLTKEYGAAVLVTDDVVAALRARERFPLRLVAENVKIRGKAETIAARCGRDCAARAARAFHG
jgi:class 3 adenylate cyclase/HAMP domain-containing protein